MKQIKYRIYKVKASVKNGKYREIFSIPGNIFFLLLLLTRSLLLRLIPRVSKIFIIKKSLIDSPLKIACSEYEFKIFSHYSEEINSFVLKRNLEDENSIVEVYSKIVADRFNKGLRAFTLMQYDEIVSIFFTTDMVCFLEQVKYNYKPEKNEIFILDIYTLLNHRRLGLYSLLLKNTINYYEANGIDTIVMGIMKHNRPTIQAQIKIGFNEIFKTLRLYSWLGFERLTVTDTKRALKDL